MGTLFEFLMLACFGASWPISAYKSYKARTAKGKSLVFILLIWIGYVFGIASKFINNNVNYVLIVYFFNIIMVSTDIILYFRNVRLDSKEQKLAHRNNTERMHEV
ncbi:MAG: hypothetical protein GX022_06430 [Clostridiaceae bacterium]|nr:hypothetical protein [Clostridiaceae bacterium]